MGIVNIEENIFENVSKKKQKQVLNEYLKKNVKGKDYYADGEKIIANKYTIGKLLYGDTLYDAATNKNIRFEIKANVIANLESVIKNSTLYQKGRKDTKKHTFADCFDRRKCLVEYKGKRYKIMFEIGKKDGVNTLYGIEHIKK